MKQKLKSEKGQVLIEAILLMVLFAGFWIGITGKIRSSGWMKTFVEGPWPKLKGMIESGVWDTEIKARLHHPNNLDRGASKKEI